RGEAVERLRGLSPALDDVAEADDLLHTEPFHVRECGAEGDVVPVLVGDERETHSVRLPRPRELDEAADPTRAEAAGESLRRSVREVDLGRPRGGAERVRLAESRGDQRMPEAAAALRPPYADESQPRRRLTQPDATDAVVGGRHEVDRR